MERAREKVERLEGESQFASIAVQPKFFKKKISVMFTSKKPVNITNNLQKFEKKNAWAAVPQAKKKMTEKKISSEPEVSDEIFV